MNWNNGTSTVAGPTADGNSAIINSDIVSFTGNDTFSNGDGTTSSVAITINQGATLAGTNNTTNPIVNLTMNGGNLLANGGNYTMAGTLTTEINGLVAGTDRDQINVTGTVNLSGNLVATFGGGLTPPTI